MRETLRQDCLPDGVTTIWQDPGEFCFTTVAVFLAAFWGKRRRCWSWAAAPGL